MSTLWRRAADGVVSGVPLVRRVQSENAPVKKKKKPRVLIAKPWNPKPSPPGFYM
jgi:hypothetical protein